ncbi:MAG: hypothetical protein M0T75_08245 [Chloroflexi bacterium]|nr:hypothetical protein [Chloroflexota bacterium]
MYGTIARLHPLPGRLDELLALEGRWRTGGEPLAAGYRGAWMFVPDHDPYDRPTVFLVAVFDDRTTYVANADSPDQDVRYREMRALLVDDPEWVDGSFFGS